MTADDTGRGEPDRARLPAVYREWNQAMLARTLTWWSGAPGLRTTLAGMVTLSAAILLPLDSSLQGTPFLREPLPFSGRPIALALLVVWLAGVLVVARWLWQVTPRPYLYSSTVRAFLILLGGAPIVGLLAVPGWRRLQETSPGWILRHHPAVPPMDLRRPRRRRSGLLRLLGRTHADTLAASLLLLSQIAALVAASLWLSRELDEGRAGRRSVLVLSLAIHSVLFVILFVLGLRAGRLGRTLPRHHHLLLVAATFFCLLPFPLSPLAASLPLMILEPGQTRSGTLLWQALVRRQGTGRSPLWLGLEEALRPGWGKLPWLQRIWSPPASVTRQPRLGPSEIRVLRLYDLRVFALALDAACLAWGLSWLAGRFPALQQLQRGLPYSALLLCGLALCVNAAHLAAGLLRISWNVLDRHPYGLYAAKSSFALAAGLFFGLEIRQGRDPQKTGNLLMLLCQLLVMLKGFSLIVTGLKPKVRWRGPWPWNEASSFLILFLLMILTGLGGQLELLPGLLGLWLVTCPLQIMLLGHRLIPALLRPFSARDALDPALPRRLRLDLAVLVLASILPLGGLAIPFCIYIRHRHWGEARSLWAERGWPGRPKPVPEMTESVDR